MYEINHMPREIEIGFIGETNFRPIEINMSEWMKKAPGGVPSIVCIRPQETEEDAYIAATTIDENNILKWTPTEADLGTHEGYGEIQIWLEKEVNGTVQKRGKSVRVKTRVNYAIASASAQVPAGQQGWMDQMTALKDIVVDAAAGIEGNVQSAAESAQQAGASQQAAAGSAAAAATSAQQAAASQSAAAGSATAANTSKEQAAASQSAAAGSAASALTSAQRAESAMTAAQSAATSASLSAQQAASNRNAAQSASTSAQAAQSNAQSAASAAGTSASNANQSATAAAASESAASQAATDAATHAAAAETAKTDTLTAKQETLEAIAAAPVMLFDTVRAFGLCHVSTNPIGISIPCETITVDGEEIDVMPYALMTTTSQPQQSAWDSLKDGDVIALKCTEDYLYPATVVNNERVGQPFIDIYIVYAYTPTRPGLATYRRFIKVRNLSTLHYDVDTKLFEKDHTYLFRFTEEQSSSGYRQLDILDWNTAENQDSKSKSEANALKAEGYAVGKQDGTDVDSTSPYFENNAEYWAEVAQDIADSLGGDIGTAVDNWLGDHPEATTTVQDGSITKAKLHTDLAGEINGKAPAIIIETEQKKTFTKEETSLKHLGFLYVNGEPDEGVAISFAENILSDVNNETTTIGETFTKTVYQNGVADLTGYVNSTKDLYMHKYGSTITGEIPLLKEIESGSVVTFGAYVKGTIEQTSYTSDRAILSIVNFHYKDGTTSGEVIRMSTSIGLNTRSFTIPENKTAYKVTIIFEIRANWSYNCSVSFGLLLDGEWVANTLPASGVISFDKAQIANGFSSMPYLSYLRYIEDTKDYVDDHIPEDVVTFDDLETYEPTLQNQHYLTPEMFGAKGDGATDDTVALQSCIDQAISNRIPMQAFGRYKTTQSLVFTQAQSNASRPYIYEINEIIYTGSDDYAITISGSCGRFMFGVISSSTGGIHLTSNSVGGASLNYIFASYVYSYGTCFYSNGITGGIHYNTIRILRANSTNGNCFESGARAGENRYYDTSCNANNGWGIYGCNGRYYNICIEGNVKNGIYARSGDAANLIGFRWEELMNHYEAGVSGTVLKVVGEGVHLRIIGPRIQLRCIDVSEMTKKTDLSDITKAVQGIILTALITNSNGYRHLGKEADIRVGKIMCEPEIKASKYIVNTAILDLRGDDPPGYPTKFVIDTDNSVIYLSDSYCAIGYNEFIVDQSQGNTCTIYQSDDDVTPIFDGAQEGTGIFKLTAYCVQNQGGTIVYYTGDDVWEIEKIR